MMGGAAKSLFLSMETHPAWLGFHRQAQLQRSCVLEPMGSTQPNPQDFWVMDMNVPTGAAEEVGWEVNCALMAREIDMRSPDLNLGLGGRLGRL